MARAMLETIPIVKFGDAPDGKLENDKGDVEMSVESEVPASQLREDDQTRQSPMVTGGTTSPTPDETTQNRDATTAPESKEEKRTGIETPTDHPNFSCPICTDDFVKGQDLRVLPCNHQFHPECIDPWLVNVSGTCPLWYVTKPSSPFYYILLLLTKTSRIDLNPSQPEGEGENQEGETNAEGQQQDETTNNDNNNNQPEETQPHRHRRISSYLHSTLNARRMRDASVEERLAALRSVREEANRDEENETENEERRRRNRLTTRLRERFRIRTRAHGTAADESGAATPAPAATQSQS